MMFCLKKIKIRFLSKDFKRRQTCYFLIKPTWNIMNVKRWDRSRLKRNIRKLKMHPIVWGQLNKKKCLNKQSKRQTEFHKFQMLDEWIFEFLIIMDDAHDRAPRPLYTIWPREVFFFFSLSCHRNDLFTSIHYK